MKNRTAPPSAPSPDERNFTDENLGVELFWEKNKRAIIAGLVVLLLAGLGSGAWVAHHQGVAANARRAFALADSVEGWQGVVQRYPGSIQAASSLLLIAQAQRQSGDLKASTETYEGFLSRFPRSPLGSLARLGQAGNEAAGGRSQQAVEILREMGASAQSFGAQAALLMEGRLLVDSDRPSEAQKVFDDVATEFPQSLAARVARAQKERMALILP